MTASTPTDVQDTLAYAQVSGNDEVYGPDGEARAHWQYVLDSLCALGQTELGNRQQKAQRILRDDGAVYTSMERPEQSNIWELDPIPMVFQSEEWREIESGLLERAELLDLVLKDLYGERQLIKQGVIPPEALFDQHGFIRACDQVTMPGEQQLIFHSVDMIRDAEGKMCIMTDRTQVPRGMGYALENRNVMTRVLPSLFRDAQVHRLALFYHAIRHKMQELSPRGDGETARVVLLTPGAYSPAYFEHTYLANFLGFPLVQGGDLTVRDGRVWMKSVHDLSPVDVIFRFVDDQLCDPVELRSDSHLGVAGLLEVARTGKVVIVNPLGASVLENPILQKYMPAIGEFFLGRALKLKNVNTYWGGDPADIPLIKANFDKLVLKHISGKNNTSVFVCELNAEEKAKWLKIFEETPQRFVAQDYLEPSSLPTMEQGQLTPRHVLLRTFAVATDQSYSVMPGSLARIAPSKRSARVAHGHGSVSKDTWVLASEPEKQFSLRASLPKFQPNQARVNLPSRVVENLFWLGRYIERAETVARLLRTVLMQLNSTLALPKDARRVMLTAITDVTDTVPGFRGKNAAKLLEDPNPELISVILDSQRMGSLRQSIHSMLGCADEVKEQLSSDAQRIMNDIRDEFLNLDKFLVNNITSAPEETMDPLVTSLLAMAGQTHESMFRGTGWRFLEIGRRIEQACQISMLMRSLLVECHSGRAQDILLETTLMSTEALISYRRRYLSEVDIDHTLELMLLNEQNPRSLLFMIKDLQQHLDTLSNRMTDTPVSPEQKSVIAAIARLQLLDLEALSKPDEDGLLRQALDEALSDITEHLWDAANKIGDRYFDHTGGPQQLVKADWDQDA